MFSPFSVATDNSNGNSILYVADSFNNRILVYKNPSAANKGAPADLIIGQEDGFSTIPQGPNQSPQVRLSEGFTLPSAILVDSQGNLYISDSGNNRILRYPQPLSQQSSILQADLVIGQGNLQSGTSVNRGFNVASNISLSLNGLHAGLAMDPKTGDLWVSDPGNNRVLRFPASQLLPYTQDPAADVVLGQNDFTTSTFNLGSNQTQLNKQALAQPSGIALDSAGRLYICDNLVRVTVWAPPFAATGGSATRVLGAVLSNDQPVSATKLGGTAPNYAPPEGVFTIGNRVFVVDTPNSRIVGYDPFETWAAETATNPSPAATTIIGQTNFTASTPNRGSKTDASAISLNFPSGAAYSGTDVWVADSNNNRVVGFPVTGGTFAVADKLYGQTEFTQLGINHTGPNGFYFAALSQTLGGGVAVDYSSNPPRLYLADPGNHRVLGYPDARNVNAGDPAAIVIGQIDFQHAIANIPGGDVLQMSDTGLRNPAGVAVDSNGDLWVADSGNGRVLRFPRPFDQTGGQQRANLALGQLSLFGQPQLDQATSNQMKTPWGIAFLFDGSVFVSDPANNRVLLFRKPEGGDFRTGQAATGVYGQRDFSSNLPGNTLDKLNGPRFISTDTDDRLYVADTGNSRITVYRQQSTQQPSGIPATATIDGLNSPIGVTVSALSGFIWVANTNGNTALRYPQFNTYQLDPTVKPDILQSVNPLYIALDPQDNPIVTEAINRISFYYPYLTFQSAANQSNRALAPGMVADLILAQGSFVDAGVSNTDIPWPKSLADLEVIVGGNLSAPITDIQPTKIRIQVPKDTPIGQADFVVRHTSNKQVVGAATLTTDVAAPGFFIIGGNPGGAIVAKNPDGSDNGPNNRVARGDVISLFGTGIGVVPNQPEDGVAPTDKLPSANPIQNLAFPTQQSVKDVVKYFGLAPGQVGAFQLDVVVPSNAVPFTAVPIAFTYLDLRSSLGPNGTTVQSTVYVK